MQVSDSLFRFTDRDMFMRFLSGGIHHKAMRHLVRIQNALKWIVGLILTNTDDSEAAAEEDTEEDDIFMDAPDDTNSADDQMSEGDMADSGDPDDDIPDGEDDYGYDEQESEDNEEQGDAGRGDGEPAGEEEPWLGPEDGEDGVPIDFEFEPSL